MKKIKVTKEVGDKIVKLLLKPLVEEALKPDFDENVLGKYLDLVTEAIKYIEVKDELE